MEHYAQGELEKAQLQLRPVDGFALPRKDRLVLYQTLASIERKLKNPPKNVVPTHKKTQPTQPKLEKPKKVIEKTVPVVAQPKSTKKVTTTPKVVLPSKKITPPIIDKIILAKRMRVQQHLAEASMLVKQGKPVAAITRYKQALSLDINNKTAIAQIAILRAQASDQITNTLIGGYEKKIAVRRGKVRSQFKTYIQLAKEKRERNDFEASLNHVHQALIVLGNDQSVFLKREYQALSAEGELLATAIEREKIAYDAKLRLKRDKETTEKNKIAVQVQRKRTEQKINTLLTRALELQREQHYEQGLELIKQVLDLDSANIPAQFMEDVFYESISISRSFKHERTRNRNIAKLKNATYESMVPYTALLTYPSEWPQLTKRRFAGLVKDSDEFRKNRRTERKLNESIEFAGFEGESFKDVIDSMRKQTGLDISVNWGVLDGIGITDETEITLDALSDVAVGDIFDNITEFLNAKAEKTEEDGEYISFSVYKGIVKITTKEQLKTAVTARTYDIRDLLIPINNFNSSDADLSQAINSSQNGGRNGGNGGRNGGNGGYGGGGGGGRGGGGGGGLFGNNNDDDNEDENRVDKADLLTNIQELIEGSIGDEAEWSDTSSIKAYNDQLIIKTGENNHRAISTLLQSLRETNSMQISVEARFLLVDHNYLEEIGMDLDIGLDNPGGNWGPIRLAQDSYGIASRPGDSGVNGSFGSGTSTEGNALSTLSLVAAGTGIGSNFIRGGFPQTALQAGVAGDPPNGNFSPFIGAGFASTKRALDFGVSFFDDLQVNLLVRATQNNRRSISLTAPRITFFNSQRAYVQVVKQIAYVASLSPVANSAGFNVGVGIASNGVLLDVQGTISADRRYVTMEVHPTLRSLALPMKEIPFTSTSDITDDSQNPSLVTSSGVIQLPEVEITDLRATVSIPDQGTLVMGGQKLVTEVDIESGVPILSKIPFINRFFTNKAKLKDQRTLLILIRPTIILQHEREELLFPGMKRNIGDY